MALEEREPAIALAKPDAADLDAAIDMTEPERPVERQRPADVLDIEARLEPPEVHLAPSPVWGEAIRSARRWGGQGETGCPRRLPHAAHLGRDAERLGDRR